MTYAYPYAIAGTFDSRRTGSYQTPVIRQTCHWRFGDLEAAGFVAYSAGSLTFRQLSGAVENFGVKSGVLGRRFVLAGPIPILTF